jgi:hypothetical protein
MGDIVAAVHLVMILELYHRRIGSSNEEKDQSLSNEIPKIYRKASQRH